MKYNEYDFGNGRDLYRRCKYVVYGSYRLPVENHVITCEPELLYNFFKFLSLFFFLWIRGVINNRIIIGAFHKKSSLTKLVILVCPLKLGIAQYLAKSMKNYLLFYLF